jgi:hypothetical protein
MAVMLPAVSVGRTLACSMNWKEGFVRKWFHWKGSQGGTYVDCFGPQAGLESTAGVGQVEQDLAVAAGGVVDLAVVHCGGAVEGAEVAGELDGVVDGRQAQAALHLARDLLAFALARLERRQTLGGLAELGGE